MCEYCKNEFNNTLIGTDNFDFISNLTVMSQIVKTKRKLFLRLEFIDKSRDTDFCSHFLINYCPMCGKRLGEQV